MELDLEIHTEVLRYSLHLEKGVNTLLTLNLGILDGGKASRLFGDKTGISFKNKVDLLYDLDVFTKAENSDMELLSVFRNKLLHDITYTSILSVIKNLDSGLKNKFKVYLEGGSIESETECRKALSRLFIKNIRTIRLKVQELRELNETKSELLREKIRINERLIGIFFEFTEELCIKIENSDLENPTISVFAQEIIKSVKKYQNMFSNVKKKTFDNKTFKAIFGIRKVTEAQQEEFQTKYDDYIAARNKS